MGEDDKKEFVERVRRHFQEITPQLNQEMEMIAELSWEDATSFLLIEYDASQFSDEFFVAMWRWMPTANLLTGRGTGF